MMYPVEKETGVDRRICSIQTVGKQLGYVVGKVACEGNLGVFVYFFGELIVFPSEKEFLNTRFCVQPDFHLPGTAGR